MTQPLTFVSLFSGADGLGLGLVRAGMTPVAFCDNYRHARNVLRFHYPDVPIYDDVRTLDAARLARDGVPVPDLVCGGFPCQDISRAGRGGGLDGARSGLWWEMHRLVGECRPAWVAVENVADLLSVNGGRDMGTVVGDVRRRHPDQRGGGVDDNDARAGHLVVSRCGCAADGDQSVGRPPLDAGGGNPGQGVPGGARE